MANNLWELCWARGGIDQAAQGVFQENDPSVGGDLAWSTAALPDVVLESGSYVTLQRYSTAGADVTLRSIAATYTPGAGATATTAVGILPLVVPQSA